MSTIPRKRESFDLTREAETRSFLNTSNIWLLLLVIGGGNFKDILKVCATNFTSFSDVCMKGRATFDEQGERERFSFKVRFSL